MKLDNLNDTLELFTQIDGTGKENCVFFAQTDNAHIGERGTVYKTVANRLTGGISGLVEEIIDGANESRQEFREALNLDVLNNYRQFLINETENSIAIIPMLFKGVLHWRTEGAQAYPESGRVIPKSLIQSIEIKKFSFITPTIRGVKINLIDGYKLEFMAITNVKTLPYHIENFRRFHEKYASK